MTSEWSQTTLGSIAINEGYGLVDGPFGSNLPASLYTNEGVPVIRGSNLALGTSRFRAQEFVFVSWDTAKRLSRSLCRPLDVIFTKKGTLGQTGLVPEGTKYDQYLLSSNQMKLTVDPLVADPLFVYYSVSSPESIEKIVRDSEATGVPKTNVTYLREFPIRLPPLSEQRAIAHILGTLDDKIELNRRMNETLEAMARALFKDWFVDFGPTRAKIEGYDPYLAPEIWDLFPDKLDEDGKPEGWEDSKVEDYLELAYGKSLPAKSRRPGGVAVYGSGGLTGFHDEALIKGPAIIVGRKGTVGSLYWEDRPIFPIDTVFYVVPKRASLSFCYQLLLSQPLAHMNTDAAVPGLNRDNAYRLEFPWPGSRLTNTFESFASPLWKKRTANLREIDTLSQSRDLLLPKLMSGEIRVGDADKIVKEFI